MENQTASAPAPVTINWVITEEAAQKVIECFDIVCKAGGLQNARIALPLAEDLMQTALKAKEAREAAAKAVEPAKN
jgi:hypothetical protein